jgi:hypothetical protein
MTVLFRRAAAGLVLAAFAAPAVAQTPPYPPGPQGSCGQPLVQTQRLAAMLYAGFPTERVTAQIERSDMRYIDFDLAERQTLTLRTEARNGADPMIAVYDRTGNLMGYDDDGGGGSDARLTLDLEAGSYCASLRLLSVAPVDRALLDVIIEAGAGTAPPPSGDSALVARPCEDPSAETLAGGSIGPGFGGITVAGLLEGEGRVRGYRMTLSEPQALRIDMSSDEFDTYLSLRLLDDSEVTSNDDHDGSDSRIEQALDAGEYCVVAQGFGAGFGAFDLSILPAGGAPSPGPGPGIAGGAHPCGNLSYPVLAEGFSAVQAPVSVSGRVDDGAPDARHLLTLAAETAVRIDLASSDFDAVLAVTDAAGAAVAENDDADGSNSRIEQVLPAGAYCVVSRGFGGGTGAFALSLAAQGGAAPALAPGPGAAPAPEPVGEAFDLSNVQIEEMGALGASVRSYAVTRDPVLWGAFSVDVTTGVAVEGMSMSGPFGLVLTNADGVPVANSASDGFGVASARIEMQVPAGRYLVGLSNDIESDDVKLRQITVTRQP